MALRSEEGEIGGGGGGGEGEEEEEEDKEDGLLKSICCYLLFIKLVTQISMTSHYEYLPPHKISLVNVNWFLSYGSSI